MVEAKLEVRILLEEYASVSEEFAYIEFIWDYSSKLQSELANNLQVLFEGRGP